MWSLPDRLLVRQAFALGYYWCQIHKLMTMLLVGSNDSIVEVDFDGLKFELSSYKTLLSVWTQVEHCKFLKFRVILVDR